MVTLSEPSVRCSLLLDRLAPTGPTRTARRSQPFGHLLRDRQSAAQSHLPVREALPGTHRSTPDSTRKELLGQWY
jgi:hypothetical protein